jgi:hypothetical protein
MSTTSVEKPRPSRRGDRPASRNPGAGSFTSDLIVGLKVWWRHTFSLASVLSGLKSLIWVAPLSVIIWIYAEQADTDKQPFAITVSVHSSDPTRVVRLVDPTDGKLNVELDGTNNNLEKIRGILAATPTLTIDVADSILSSTGNHSVPGAIVNDQDIFRSNGITVDSVLPHDLTINVDAQEDVTVQVKPAPDERNFSAPPIFTPHEVHVKAPHSVISAARAAGNLVAYAHLDQTREVLTPGSHDLTAVPLTVPFGNGAVAISPSSVAAHVEIKKSDVTLLLPAVPVWVVYPPGMDDKYKAVYDPSLPSVTVVGPEEQIATLESGSFKPKARLDVSPADLPVDTDHERRLQFELPTDVHASPEDLQRTISFRLTERKASD